MQTLLVFVLWFCCVLFFGCCFLWWWCFLCVPHNVDDRMIVQLRVCRPFVFARSHNHRQQPTHRQHRKPLSLGFSRFFAPFRPLLWRAFARIVFFLNSFLTQVDQNGRKPHTNGKGHIFCISALPQGARPSERKEESRKWVYGGEGVRSSEGQIAHKATSVFEQANSRQILRSFTINWTQFHKL